MGTRSTITSVLTHLSYTESGTDTFQEQQSQKYTTLVLHFYQVSLKKQNQIHLPIMLLLPGCPALCRYR